MNYKEQKMEQEISPARPLSLWRNRDYLLLWLGQAVSSLGTGISKLAFLLLVLALTNSPAAAGIAGALGQLPYVLFSLPAGALVDRWDRKQVMIACTLGLTFCLASIPVALLTGHLTVVQLYIISFLVGTFAIFYELAELGALTHVVSKAQLPAAVAQNEAVYSTVSLLAPSLSGILYSAGRLFPFVADVISYLVLLGSLLNIHSPLQQERGEGPRHLFADVREGIHWLWSHAVVRFLVFLTSYLYVVMSGSVLIVLVIARQHLIPASIIGLIFGIGGVGNLVGTALCTPLQRRLRFGWVLSSMLILFVLLFPLYAIASAPILLGAVVAGLALIDSIFSIQVSSYRLAIVPDELQGRVGSVYRLIIFASLALGQSLIGPCIEHFGVLPTIGVLWSGLLLFTGITFVNLRVRNASFP